MSQGNGHDAFRIILKSALANEIAEWSVTSGSTCNRTRVQIPTAEDFHTDSKVCCEANWLRWELIRFAAFEPAREG